MQAIKKAMLFSDAKKALEKYQKAQIHYDDKNGFIRLKTIANYYKNYIQSEGLISEFNAYLEAEREKQ